MAESKEGARTKPIHIEEINHQAICVKGTGGTKIFSLGLPFRTEETAGRIAFLHDWQGHTMIYTEDEKLKKMRFYYLSRGSIEYVGEDEKQTLKIIGEWMARRPTENLRAVGFSPVGVDDDIELYTKLYEVENVLYEEAVFVEKKGKKESVVGYGTNMFCTQVPPRNTTDLLGQNPKILQIASADAGQDSDPEDKTLLLSSADGTVVVKTELNSHGYTTTRGLILNKQIDVPATHKAVPDPRINVDENSMITLNGKSLPEWLLEDFEAHSYYIDHYGNKEGNNDHAEFLAQHNLTTGQLVAPVSYLEDILRLGWGVLDDCTITWNGVQYKVKSESERADKLITKYLQSTGSERYDSWLKRVISTRFTFTRIGRIGEVAKVDTGESFSITNDQAHMISNFGFFGNIQPQAIAEFFGMVSRQ